MLNPPVSPQTWPYPPHSFAQSSQDSNIIVVIDQSDPGNPLRHHIVLYIEEKSQHDLEIREAHGKFFAVGEFGDFQCILFPGHT